MGLFSFVKDAGQKIFGDDEKPQQDAIAARDEQVRKLQAARAKRLGDNARRELAEDDVDLSGIEITVDGDRVQASGTVKNQATREKIILALGNVQGVGAVEENLRIADAGEGAEATAAAADGESTFYTVRSGDTLSKIAEQHYGDPGKYHRIFEANRPLLKDPDKIYPGQTLRIPPRS